jgi:hypothetical protein
VKQGALNNTEQQQQQQVSFPRSIRVDKEELL